MNTLFFSHLAVKKHLNFLCVFNRKKSKIILQKTFSKAKNSQKINLISSVMNIYK